MKTKKCPTEDWAQRTDAGLALLPLVYPALFLLLLNLCQLLPESQIDPQHSLIFIFSSSPSDLCSPCPTTGHEVPLPALPRYDASRPLLGGTDPCSTF